MSGPQAGYPGKKVTKKLTKAQSDFERASRAIRHFHRVQPNLEAFARVFTGNKKMSIVPTASMTATDGKAIYLRVPIEMGDEKKHRREVCQRRDGRGNLMCEACEMREELLVSLFHEIAHNAYDSFVKMSNRDKEQAVEEAVREAERFGLSGRRLEVIRRSMEEKPPKTYGEASARISPYMQPLINGLEDARINVLTMEARKGMKVMFEASVHRIFEQGIEQPDGSRMHWSDAPHNAQVSVALSQYAQDCYEEGWFAPEVAEAMRDPELRSLAKECVNSSSAAEVYRLGFPILEKLRSLGFCKTEGEPEDEPEPLTSDEGEPDNEDTGGDHDEETDDPTPGEDSVEHEDAPDDEEVEGDQDGDDEEGDASPDTDADSSDDQASGDGDDEEDADDGEEPGDEAEGDPGEDGDGATGEDEGNTGASQEDASQDEQDESGADGDAMSDPDTDDTDGADPTPDEDGNGSDTATGDASDDDPSDPDGSDDTDDQDPDTVGAGTKESHGAEGGEEDGDDVEKNQTDGGGGTGGDGNHGEPEPDKGSPDDVATAIGTFCTHPHLHDDDPIEKDEYREGDDHEDEPERDPEEEAAIERALVQERDFDEPSKEVYESRVMEAGPAFNMSKVMRRPDKYAVIPTTEPIIQQSLGKMRQAFSENKKGSKERNLRSGKVNAKALGRRAPVEDDRVFQKRRRPGKRDYFVVIGMDVSGSTDNGLRIQNIKSAAMAQAELLSRIGIPFEVWAHTCFVNGIDAPETTYGQWLENQMYKVKTIDERWDTKTKKRLESIVPSAANLDGHTMEFYRKRLDKSRATDKVLMYYTDGDMPYENYREELRILKRELRECATRGYEVVGVGFETDSPNKHGLDTVRIDGIEDVPKVVRELHKRLTR